MEMETRLSGGDVLLDPSTCDDGEEAFGPIAYLTDASHEPPAMIEAHQPRRAGQRRHRHRFGSALDDRSRRIVEERWLKVNDDGSGGMTLHDLAAEVRRERRAHPPNRGGGHEEDESGFGGVRLNQQLRNIGCQRLRA
jgi:DNA-directed RNA polymerase sigma subunit (sigma70/sigma32)